MPDPVTAIIGASVIGAGSSIMAANKQEQAAENAADAQLQANQQNIDFQKWLYEQNVELNKPWYDVGSTAIGQLWDDWQAGKFSPTEFNFQEDPGYQFRLQEGMRALDNSAASRGMLLSGGQARATSRYASDLASQEYGNAFSRWLSQQQLNQQQYNMLAGLSNAGQSAAQQNVAAGNALGVQVGQGYANQGNALAQMYNSIGNAQAGMYGGLAQSANQGIGNYLMYDMLQSGGGGLFGGGTQVTPESAFVGGTF